MTRFLHQGSRNAPKCASRLPPALLRVMVVAALLVFAQVAAALHELDLAAHTESACASCLAHAASGGALPGSPCPVSLVPGSTAVVPAVARAGVASPPCPDHHSRAPPYVQR